MDAQTAERLAAEALAKRKAWPGYFPTAAELQAVDVLLIAQARRRLEQQQKPAA